jgi:uncharacterized phage protein (TIGR02220 family)
MTTSERGMFFQLLCEGWAEKTCSLPNDESELQFLAAASDDEWARGSKKVLAMFEVRDGRLVNAKQQEMLEEQNGRLAAARRNREKVQKHREGLVANNGHGEQGGDPIPETTKRHQAARPILHYLIEKSGTRFRETETNLGFIGERLAEGGVDADGVRKMIDRQVAKWKGTDMADYLRPETLFNKTKFDGYYAARDMPIETGPKKPPRQGLAPGYAPGVTP